MAPNPGFVFVSCTGKDHKGDKKLMPRLRQHVMLHHLQEKDKRRRISVASTPMSRTSRSSRDSAEGSPATTDRSEETNIQHSSSDEQTLAVVPLTSESARTSMGAPFDPFDALPVKGVSDMGDIFIWFYSGQAPPASHQWQNSTRYHWLDKHWEMTRQSRTMFNFSLCFALEKKGIITHTSQATRIFKYRSAVLRAVQDDLTKHAHNLPGQTVATIGGLAYIAIRDGDVDVAKAHIKAIAQLAPLDRYEMYVWLYVVWTDLRVAAATFTIPTLKHYIPHECRGSLGLSHEDITKATKLAFRNLAAFPAIGDQNTHAATQLFRKLHETCIAVDKVNVELTHLYGHLYDTQYKLLRITSRAWKTGDRPNETMVKILLLAVQLAFWTSTFYVLPQGRRFNVDLHSHLVQQMDKLGDIVSAWESYAGLDSLLWVAFVAAASAMEFDLSSVEPFIEVLKRAVARMDIRTRDDFKESLQLYPWTTHGSARMCPFVWAEISGEVYVPESETPKRIFWIEEMAVR
ncbi:hypothetical protein CAC42_583 [Sphaceloma murrayae]|uniref:Uncharacterized protein n=1 Tax=Sphaceloma murrayae TaxID=2082308 RepID=A0A2K1R3X1_9PEZI|nr:hypothetical protein CAC42_583 [Sphaceloma murrayae]